MNRRPPLRTAGFTLIEVMIAMIVGLILLTGLYEVYMGSRNSFLLREGMGAVHDNGRFALALLGRDLQLAGYPRNDTLWSSTTAPLTRPIYGAALAAPLTADGGGNNSDTFTVMYQTDALGSTAQNDPTTDALGNSTDYNGAGVYPNGNYYAKNHYYIDANGNLACRTYDFANVLQDDQVLVEGVGNMQILYGEDTDLPTDGSANVYRSAAAVTNWSNVVSVRIELLVNSVDIKTVDTDPNTYALLDAPPLGPFSDRLVRRVVGTTLVLRNRM